MEYNSIYKKAEHYVTDLFQNASQNNLLYHNLKHTQTVVSRTKEIAGHYKLIESDMLVLYVAAWFHDTGYLNGEGQMHEERSVDFMKEFVKDFNLDESIVKNIEDCIIATKLAVEPVNLLQQILRDADTYNLGTNEFDVTNKLVFEEVKAKKGYINKPDWNSKTIQMLEKHQFYTSYCKEMLNDKKKKNIKKLKKKEEKEPKTAEEKSILKEHNNFTTKGIQTMLRLTSENHMKLSDMADGKANILISVNAIIISVILSVLLRRLQTDTYLTIPTIIFLAFSVVTIVVSILATRPKVSEGTFENQDIIDKKTNLLFFGNFYKTSLDVYEKAMGQMMADPDYLYGSLVKDIYFLGVVIGRKYKLIRLAYNIFMIGIVISVLAFAIAVFFGNSADGTITNTSGSPL